MTSTAEQLLRTATTLAAALPTDRPLDSALQTADEARILLLLQNVGELRRLVDAVGARMAGELERRWPVPGDDPLPLRMGERTVADVVSRQTGLPIGTAQQWCTLGQALAARTTILGEILPARHEATAAAVDAGALTAEAGVAIVRLLFQLEAFADQDERDGVEAFLVEEAPRLTIRELSRLCGALRDRFDPDGVEPREETLRARSGLRKVRRRDGGTRWILDLHPEAEGFLTAAIDARTAPRRAVRFDDDPAVHSDLAAGFDPAIEDGRTHGQKQLDALVAVARESLARDDGELAGVPVAMIVTCDSETLRDGVGGATILGVDQPISASTVRRLAVGADIIPVVLGGESEILDLGRARRLHSRAQRLAMALRDRGCIWPACEAPPSWCEAAHAITPWKPDGRNPGGRTSLDNGALLCPFHHRRLDNDGWHLEVRQGVPYLIPPPWIDPARTPRRGGRERPPPAGSLKSNRSAPSSHAVDPCRAG